MKYFIILSFFLFVNVSAQRKEMQTLMEIELETQARQDLKLLSENIEISPTQEEQLLVFFIHKNKFLSRTSIDVIQRDSVVKSTLLKRLESILNQNSNDKPIKLEEDLARQLNLSQIEITK